MTTRMKFEFKRDDFKWDVESLGKGITSQQMADRANALLQAHLDKCVRVYGDTNYECEEGESGWFMQPREDDSHTALLFDVEEVKDGE